MFLKLIVSKSISMGQRETELYLEGSGSLKQDLWWSGQIGLKNSYFMKSILSIGHNGVEYFWIIQLCYQYNI